MNILDEDFAEEEQLDNSFMWNLLMLSQVIAYVHVQLKYTLLTWVWECVKEEVLDYF